MGLKKIKVKYYHRDTLKKQSVKRFFFFYNIEKIYPQPLRHGILQQIGNYNNKGEIILKIKCIVIGTKTSSPFT